MSEYRRIRLPGGTSFFTVNLLNRRSRLLVTHIQTLRNAVRTTRQVAPFHIDAWVVLPDHVHCHWTLPPGDTDFSMRRRLIKAHFSQSLPSGEARSASRISKDERGIWQRRFWEHTIRDDNDFGTHLDYIHVNPVKHGLVSTVADWPYSSFHRYVAQGQYPRSWQPEQKETPATSTTTKY